MLKLINTVVIMLKNQNGFSAIHTALILVVVGIVGFTGWYVFNTQQKANENLTVNNSDTPSFKKKDTTTANSETKSNVPDGWVQYKDESSGVSFYHPAAWEKGKFKVHKTSVAENVKGNNLGPYSANYIFKKADNKWYALDSEGNQVTPNNQYATVSTIPASTYPAVYGYAGEGGGVYYYTVFTNGTSSYLIELPVIAEETDPTGLDMQKQAITDLNATIKIDR